MRNQVYDYFVLVFPLQFQVLIFIFLVPHVLSKSVNPHWYMIEGDKFHTFWCILESALNPLHLHLGSVRIIWDKILYTVEYRIDYHKSEIVGYFYWVESTSFEVFFCLRIEQISVLLSDCSFTKLYLIQALVKFLSLASSWDVIMTKLVIISKRCQDNSLREEASNQVKYNFLGFKHSVLSVLKSNPMSNQVSVDEHVLWVNSFSTIVQ